MMIMRFDLIRCNVVPFVGHDLFDVAHGQLAMHSDRLFPIVKEGVIEWRHALCRLSRHEDDVHHVSTSFTERLHHLLGVVDARLVDDEGERRIVQGGGLLTERAEDVVDQHVGVDSFHSTIRSFLRCVDAWRKCLFAVAARDHVESFCIGRIVLHDDERLLVRQHDGGSGGLADAHGGLIEEEHLRLGHALQLATQRRDAVTM